MPYDTNDPRSQLGGTRTVGTTRRVRRSRRSTSSSLTSTPDDVSAARHAFVARAQPDPVRRVLGGRRRRRADAQRSTGRVHGAVHVARRGGDGDGRRAERSDQREGGRRDAPRRQPARRHLGWAGRAPLLDPGRRPRREVPQRRRVRARPIRTWPRGSRGPIRPLVIASASTRSTRSRQDSGRFGRLLRCSTIMVNYFYPDDGPRDPHKLSPHHHDDFEQISLQLEGDYVHHIRTPWTVDMDAWRDDDHQYCTRARPSRSSRRRPSTRARACIRCAISSSTSSLPRGSTSRSGPAGC